VSRNVYEIIYGVLLYLLRIFSALVILGHCSKHALQKFSHIDTIFHFHVSNHLAAWYFSVLAI